MANTKTTPDIAAVAPTSASDCDLSKLNIYQRMSKITSELKSVSKDMEVGTNSNKYKAVSERSILDAVKPLEAKYGVFSYPKERVVLESHICESESSYNNKTTKKNTFMTRIMTTYRFVNIDNPDDFVETTTFAEGIDTQDKGSGKAMTYCDKYALMKMYKISTGDDPDANASDNNSQGYQQNGYQQNYNQPYYSPAPQQGYQQNGGQQRYNGYNGGNSNYDDAPPLPEPPSHY